MRPSRPLQQSPYSIERDITSRQGRQLLELLSLDRTVLLTKAKKLHQSHDNATDEIDDLLEVDNMAKLMDLSHLVHYVYTPILFLPKWRYEAHSTRQRVTRCRGYFIAKFGLFFWIKFLAYFSHF